MKWMNLMLWQQIIYYTPIVDVFRLKTELENSLERFENL